MSYLASFNINTDKQHPFPFDIPAVKFSKDVDLSNPVTFFIGDNGTGKSTLLETIAYRLQLPHMDGSDYGKKSFQAARTLLPYLEFSWKKERSIGFFFRAEDFGDLLNSVDRRDAYIYDSLRELKDQVPDHIIQEMRENANYQIHHIRKNYGQELQSFSHGEAFLHIMQERVHKSRGIFLLDEPEAALSPTKQLSLLYFIQEHLKSNLSQFIIATHSPILMSYPNATIYEITEENMNKTSLEQTEHFSVTKSILNNPGAFFKG